MPNCLGAHHLHAVIFWPGAVSAPASMAGHARAKVVGNFRKGSRVPPERKPAALPPRLPSRGPSEGAVLRCIRSEHSTSRWGLCRLIKLASTGTEPSDQPARGFLQLCCKKPRFEAVWGMGAVLPVLGSLGSPWPGICHPPHFGPRKIRVPLKVGPNP